ncbi:uncharacterized protein PRCAT00000909001 [Priceomyces carsonii]|uniref:uncharacterized protein n=1 Tax=Priceomyces carsonii TaxID=28549 RepID=UPI002EDAF704|nr:unnamed protein product [Priceomyces carsonii]
MLKMSVTSSGNSFHSAASDILNDGSSSINSNARYNDDRVNFITFNQDASCIAIGLNNGYKIFSCRPNFGKCYQFKKDEAVRIIEMLYCTSLVAVVGLGEEPGSSPRKLKIINSKRQSTICDLVFPSTILQVKLTKSRMVVVLEDQIYIYDITTMKLLHTIETSINSNGICAISSEGSDIYLAYPSPPKTITHDSLLVTGINTNGGVNSVQNNIQSVSNSPNRIGDVIIFNVTTLQPVCVIEAHKSALAAITLSSDGLLLATASDKGTIIRVFSVTTGIKLYQFRRGTYPTKIYSLKFSSDDMYVIATSASGTVHIFRLGEDEALKNKHKRRRSSKPKPKPIPGYETITEEAEEANTRKPADEEEDDEIDDGDDSDAEDEDGDDESIEIIPKQRKFSQGSNNSAVSAMSGISNISSEDAAAQSVSSMPSNKDSKTEPLVDQTRLSVARMIRRSSQTLGRKAAQKMGDFLPSRFSSILEPTRHFASLKINTMAKDVKSIAVMSNEIQEDLVPQALLAAKKDKDHKEKEKDSVTTSFNQNVKDSSTSKEMLSLNLLHINVVTSEGFFCTYGLDPERGGDCILLHQYSLLDESS